MNILTLEKEASEKMTKKNLGAFYTPEHVVEYMIGLLGPLNEDSSILEPCGGDGAFVKKIIEIPKISSRQLTVWDINPSVEGDIEEFGVNFQIKDSLLETDFNNLFQPRTFSHIIGNPPYLNKQSFYIKENKNRLKKLYLEIGANDTYAMFLYLGGKLLGNGGKLSYIISDTFLTLGIHKKLRTWLLNNFTIEEITICPADLFAEAGASVKTAIITIKKSVPSVDHNIIFNDCSGNQHGDYNGQVYRVNQHSIFGYPDNIFSFKEDKKFIQFISNSPKLIDKLEGGLGMHTTNNKRYLYKIDYKNEGIGIPLDQLHGLTWRIYHKRGGDRKYYTRPTYAIRWDIDSIKMYKGMNGSLDLAMRDGFIVSGISSSLSARLKTQGALWESNKAMCFFPKNPILYPAEFFIGILNSSLYNRLAKSFNHTSSFQIRDFRKLPLLNFTKNDIRFISDKTKHIISNLKNHPEYDYSLDQADINKIVNRCYERQTSKI